MRDWCVFCKKSTSCRPEDRFCQSKACFTSDYTLWSHVESSGTLFHELFVVWHASRPRVAPTETRTVSAVVRVLQKVHVSPSLLCSIIHSILYSILCSILYSILCSILCAILYLILYLILYWILNFITYSSRPWRAVAGGLWLTAQQQAARRRGGRRHWKP